ncbi:MAG: zinc ribbon domain-containing protein [Ruminiclostridium sp.]|nr:zinc ribbon domain-containing protein [Ruminiclostridium sp.]
MKNCKKCGNEMNDKDIFCQKCGEIAGDSEFGTKCPKCGCICDDEEEFCGECGHILKVAAPKTADKANTESSAMDEVSPFDNTDTNYVNAKNFKHARTNDKSTSLFVENDEYTISTLGSGVFQNVFSGAGAASVNGVLTQKRLYLSGKSLEKAGKSWRGVTISKIIEAEDITGTGFVYVGNVTAKVFAWIFVVIAAASAMFCIVDKSALTYMLIAIALAVVSFVTYIKSRLTIFFVEYAGGEIGFDVKWLNSANTADFQRQIHLIKGKRRKESK